VNLKVIVFEDVDWINEPQDRAVWRTLVNMDFREVWENS
jgi:hypothetical protein